jgi:hypothetical protein
MPYRPLDGAAGVELLLLLLLAAEEGCAGGSTPEVLATSWR